MVKMKLRKVSKDHYDNSCRVVKGIRNHAARQKRHAPLDRRNKLGFNAEKVVSNQIAWNVMIRVCAALALHRAYYARL